jgi:hypothetical protein
MFLRLCLPHTAVSATRSSNSPTMSINVRWPGIMDDMFHHGPKQLASGVFRATDRWLKSSRNQNSSHFFEIRCHWPP